MPLDPTPPGPSGPAEPQLPVRVARAEDVPAIRRLAIEIQRYHHERRPDLFTAEGTDTAEEILERIASPSHEYWVALGAGAMVGYALTHWGERPANRWHQAALVLEVQQMGVTEAWRGRGVGRALWDRVRERAVAESVSRIEVAAWAFNREALAFYERLGFGPFHQRLVLEVGARTGAEGAG